MGRTNYPYAVARVQAKRAKLIPPAEYEKLLKMDVSEITRTIEESTYKAEVDELAARFSGLDLLEAALSVNEERTYAEVRRMLQGEGGDLLRLFLGRHEVRNLKTILRGKRAGASREELVRELLIEDLDTYNLYQALLADDVQSVDDVAAALERQGTAGAMYAAILHSVPSGSDLSAYEDALDKAMFVRLVKSLSNSKVRGATQFLQVARLEIDARNILNAARWVGQSGDFSSHVIPNGRTRVADIMALANAASLDEFAEQLSDHPWQATLAPGLDEARSTGRLAPLQTAVDKALMDDLDRLSHANPLSIIPIVMYLVRKHREVVRLRALARGKAAGLSEARLREVIA